MLNRNSTFYSITAYGEEGEEYTYSLTNAREDTMPRRFGIQIVLRTEEGIFRGESERLFYSIERARAFLCFLAKHLVTPSNLPYVIEDILELALTND